MKRHTLRSIIIIAVLFVAVGAIRSRSFWPEIDRLTARIVGIGEHFDLGWDA